MFEAEVSPLQACGLSVETTEIGRLDRSERSERSGEIPAPECA